MRPMLRYAALITTLAAAAAALAQTGPSRKFNPQEQFQPIPFPVANSPQGVYQGTFTPGTSTAQMGQTWLYAGQVWQSLTNANTTTPAAGAAAWKTTGPPPGAAAFSGTDYSIQYPVGGAASSDQAVVISPIDHSVVALGPRVNVRNPLFATGSGISAYPGTNCVGVNGNPTGVADPTATYDSTCAIQNAAIYAMNTSFDGGTIHPQLYFSGHFIVGNNYTGGYVGILEFVAKVVGIVGDDHESSILQNFAPHATLLTFVNSPKVSIRDIQLKGNSYNTHGDLLDLYNNLGYSIHKVRFEQNGGIAINAQGSSERGFVLDTEAGGNAKVFNEEGPTNETYIYGFDWTFNGYSGSWNYSSNANPLTGVLRSTACLESGGAISPWAAGTYTYSAGNPQTVSMPNGVTYNLLATTSTTPQFISTSWQQCGQPMNGENRELVRLANAQNMHISDGSLKGTVMGGIRPAMGTGSVRHVYTEASVAAAGAYNPSLYIGDAVNEISHVTGAVAANSLTIPVDDAMFQGPYANNPAYANSNYVRTNSQWALYPIDYSPGSTTPSAYWTGMLQGQYEFIAPFGASGAFGGDGAFHAASRANSGTVAPGTAPGIVNAAVAIPAPTLVNGVTVYPAVIARLPQATGFPILVEDNHLNMVHPSNVSGVEGTGGCSDTGFWAQTDQWIGNPLKACAEIWVGATPDLYTTLPTSRGAGGQLIMRGQNGMSGDSNEVNGSGRIKCATNCNIVLDMDNQPLQAPVPGATAFRTYKNNKVGVDFIDWGNNVSSIGWVEDPSARYYMHNGGGPSSLFNQLDMWYQDPTIAGNPFSEEKLGGGASCIYTDTSNNLYSAQTTATATTQVASLTVASASGITVGEAAVGSGIPLGTTVTAISGTTITLSSPVNATLTGTPVAFSTELLPGTRACTNTDGSSAHYLYNNTTQAYVPDPHYSTNLKEAAPASSAIASGSPLTMAVAPAGTIPGDGSYRSTCQTTLGSSAVSPPGAYYTGFDNTSLGTMNVSFTQPLPPGVVYGLKFYGYGTDAQTGQTGVGMAVILCNTDQANTKSWYGNVILTQVQ